MRAVIQALSPKGSHTVDATISSATAIAVAGADAVLIQATGQNIRFTLDGTTPEAAVGFVLYAGGDPVLVDLSQGITLTVIEESATATLHYQGFEYGR